MSKPTGEYLSSGPRFAEGEVIERIEVFRRRRPRLLDDHVNLAHGAGGKASAALKSVTLEPGDLLIAYTDGISEAMTADDEEWGESRMLAAVSSQPSASAIEILDGIFLAADAFTAGAEQHDDMTLLVMKLKT